LALSERNAVHGSREVIFYLGKWVGTPVLLLFGILEFRIAYLKRRETTPFYVRDLFSNRQLFQRSKQQLLLEGIFSIGLGVFGIFAFFWNTWPRFIAPPR
jgi:hypothetical protein